MPSESTTDGTTYYFLKGFSSKWALSCIFLTAAAWKLNWEDGHRHLTSGQLFTEDYSLYNQQKTLQRGYIYSHDVCNEQFQRLTCVFKTVSSKRWSPENVMREKVSVSSQNAKACDWRQAELGNTKRFPWQRKWIGGQSGDARTEIGLLSLSGTACVCVCDGRRCLCHCYCGIWKE